MCPDYTSGYLMLAHTDRIVLLDESLFVSCGSGNGSAFRRRGALADRFMRDLGMTWQDLVDRMPTDACFTSALVLNDLMRLKETLAGALRRARPRSAALLRGLPHRLLRASHAPARICSRTTTRCSRG